MKKVLIVLFCLMVFIIPSMFAAGVKEESPKAVSEWEAKGTPLSDVT